MLEAQSIPSAPPGAAPDFLLDLDGIAPRPDVLDSAGTRGPSAYGSLISRALFEVAARRDAASPPPPRRRTAPEAPAAPASDPRVLAFVEALFEPGARRSRAVAEAAFSGERDPQKLAASLFGPAARCIGERWIADENDFLQVTIALARMQRLFSRLAADNPPAVRPDAARRLLLAPAPGEQHGFGLSVVEDAFRRAGWTVDRCDEGERALRLAAANDYRLIGVSVGSERLVPALKPFVDRLRAMSRNRSAVLMAGGGVAVRQPRVVLDLGFDLAAADASSGVELAEALVAEATRESHPGAFAH